MPLSSAGIPAGYVPGPTALSIDYSTETNRYRDFTSRSGFSNWSYDGTNDWLGTTAHSFCLGLWNYSYQDQKITATVRLNNPSGASDDDVRLICRYRSSEDDYYALLLEPTADIVRLRKTTSAGVTTLQEIHEAGLAVDTDYTVVLQCYGPIIRASIAELSLNLGVIDFDLTQGCCGMGSNGCYIRVKSVTCDVADEITIASNVVWPDSGTTTMSAGHAIRAPLWYRAFSPHGSSPDVTSTVDCHLGADIGGQSSRDPVYAVMAGIVNRLNESFTSFQSSAQYTRLFNEANGGTFTLDTANTRLRMAPAAGSSTFESGAMKLSFKHTPSPTTTGGGEDNIDLRATISDTVPSDWQGGIYLYEDSTHYARLYLDEFSGNLVCSYRNGGAETTINSATIPASLNALRLVWDTSAGTVRGYYATDGGAAIDSWTAWGAATVVGLDADLELGVFLANPQNTSPDNTLDVEDIGYFWQLMVGGRFGNYVQFTSRDPRNPTTAALTWDMVHMDEILVSAGQVIAAGELIGYVGKSGFNSRSGPVLSDHIHWEASAGSFYFYDNTRPSTSSRRASCRAPT